MINHSLPGSECEAASRQTVPASSVDRLCLPESIREQILIHLLDATPNEGVGLLAVVPPTITDDGVREAMAVRFYPGTNIEASPSRFTMDPGEVIAAFREIRETGWQLGAIVHSHVTGPATPSTTDLREARYPEALLMIVSFADQPAHVRVWRVAQEHDLRIVQPVTVDVVLDLE
jgi:proteasome lid subunit RPN8/RPN11